MLEMPKGFDACSDAEMKHHLIFLSRMPGQFLNHCCATESLATQHNKLKKKKSGLLLFSLHGFLEAFSTILNIGQYSCFVAFKIHLEQLQNPETGCSEGRYYTASTAQAPEDGI